MPVSIPISCQRPRGMPIGFNTAGTTAFASRLASHCKTVFPDRLVGRPAHLGAFDRDEPLGPEYLPERDEKFEHLLPGLALFTGKDPLIFRIEVHPGHHVARRKSSSRPSTIVASTPTFTFVPSSFWQGSSDEPRTPVITMMSWSPLTRVAIAYSTSFGFSGIDILVHDNHVLERGVGRKRRHDRVLPVALRALFDLDNRVEIPAAALGQHDILDFGNPGYGPVDLRLVGAAHQDLVLVAAGQDAVIDEVRLCVHPGELDHRLARTGS